MNPWPVLRWGSRTMMQKMLWANPVINGFHILFPAPYLWLVMSWRGSVRMFRAGTLFWHSSSFVNALLPDKKKKKKSTQSWEKNFHYKVRARLNTSISLFLCPLFQNAVVGKWENKSLKRKNILCKRSSSNVVVHVMGDRLEWQRCVISLEKNVKLQSTSG